MDRFHRADLMNLSQLLNHGLALEKVDNIEDSATRNWSPGDVINKVRMKVDDKKEPTKNLSKQIWEDDEVLDEEVDEARNKLKPQYKIIYQQSVTPDDIYLQMSGKDPSSSSCECLIIKINLPGTEFREDISLNTSASKLICKTKKFYLSMDLPKEIDPTKSSAKWIVKENELAVKLFVNEKKHILDI